MRQLVRREIGVDVCRQAVIDFAAQMDGEFSGDAADNESSHDGLSAHRNPAAHSPRVPELDEFLESFESPSQADAEVASPAADTLDDDTIETELSFDSLETESERDSDTSRRASRPRAARRPSRPRAARRAWKRATKFTTCHRSTRPWRTRTSWRPRRAPSTSSPPWIRRRSTSLKKQSSRTWPMR